MQETKTMVIRLCTSGPLLFVGLLMVINPTSFLLWLRVVGGLLQNFKERLHGIGREPLLEPDAGEIAPSLALALRCFGFVLIVFSVVSFAQVMK